MVYRTPIRGRLVDRLLRLFIRRSVPTILRAEVPPSRDFLTTQTSLPLLIISPAGADLPGPIRPEYHVSPLI